MTKHRDDNGQFTKGNPGRPKGAKGKKTETIEAIGLESWESIQEFITTEGAEKWIEEIRQLDGKDYIQAYTTMLEYFRPKLARTEMKAETQAIVWNEMKTYGAEKPFNIKDVVSFYDTEDVED